MKQVAATPYAFPVEGNFEPKRAALLVIDMQRDFCDPAGYMGRRGADVGAAAWVWVGSDAGAGSCAAAGAGERIADS